MHNGTISESIEIETGVRQGCTLFPLLFLIVVQWIISKTVDNRRGPTWKLNIKFEDLEYADDVCLIIEKCEHLQNKLNLLQLNAAKAGLNINIKKTNTLTTTEKDLKQLVLNGEQIKNVQSFSYLGSILEGKGGCQEDVKVRIGEAQTSFKILQKIWTSNVLSRNTKIRIFNSNIISILLYGSESWALNKQQEKQLQTFVNKCLRKILKIYWPVVITNIELRNITGQEPIHISIMRRRWNWIGHTLRKPTSDITSQALEYTVQGSRKQGRPNLTWKRKVSKECNELNVTWNEVKQIAKNKDNWKTLVEMICANAGEAEEE